jgi:methylated-DNA-protein-cysteine methyltransferase-like protein|tara:strand:- start:110 stop:541 length:432 start_codon:yes stop_codon:yes gene_type:complete
MGIKKNNSNQNINKTLQSIEDENRGSRPENQPTAQNFDTIDDSTELNKPQLIWQIVASIPKGKVASYGQIADLAGLPGYARYVGTTLSRLPAGTKLPWHRVVNASMKLAERSGSRMIEQRRLLEAEDVTFLGQKIPSHYHWQQ